MKRSTKGLAALATGAMAVLGAVGVPAAAHADVSACTVAPAPGQRGANPAVAACPAGAGTFTFRVALTCADGYPNLRLYPAYGPWVQAGMTASSKSSYTCQPSVPGSAFIWEARIETQ